MGMANAHKAMPAAANAAAQFRLRRQTGKGMARYFLYCNAVFFVRHSSAGCGFVSAEFSIFVENCAEFLLLASECAMNVLWEDGRDC